MGEEFIEMVDCPDGTEADDGRLAVPDGDKKAGFAAEEERQLGVFAVEQGVDIAQDSDPAFSFFGVHDNLHQMLDALIYVQNYFLSENKDLSVANVVQERRAV